ncbi:AAA family ATPase [Vibrio splendidus]|uniref:AAA family ATPase n=1 Tax=Vibrio splendidus TaxID=29497 RepID=UPI000D3B845E|nr:AAA family ATPase [Vibrio splendidus]PTP56346.1 hypothetical protein CWO05_02195 [Vibrio splendidus]
MKIESLSISGVHGRESTINIRFHDDINIITGSNGAGKTTILKSVWYLISGNIERLIQEVEFNHLELKTSNLTVVIATSQSKTNKIIYNLTIDFLDSEQEIPRYAKQFPQDRIELVNEANMIMVDYCDQSVFFPTFRRIEGGYNISGRRKGLIHRQSKWNTVDTVEDVLGYISDSISVKNHKFVSSVSTIDIKKIISDLYSSANEDSDHLSKDMINKLLSLTEMHERNRSHDEVGAFLDSDQTLALINNSLNLFKDQRDNAFLSINHLSDLVTKVFNHSGLSFGDSLTLGDAESAIDSDLLSSGEKQMLSFLCYNMTNKNCPMFIDEPELSLHVDWQRILIKLLQGQNSGNQYFIATHSPFIYALFSDKEIMVAN